MKNANKNFILSLETTSKICGVSLSRDDEIIYEINSDSGLNHSITLFLNIDLILKKFGLDFENIKLIKVSNGPGSFTGVRIGIATAIGLSEKYNTKIEYVDTLDSLAYNVKNKNDFIISMIDAKVGRIYYSIYKSDNLKKYLNDSVISVKDLCFLLNKYFYNRNIVFTFVGDGALKYKNEFSKSLKIKYKVYKECNELKSSSIAFTTGKSYMIPQINYLMASKAERDRNG